MVRSTSAAKIVTLHIHDCSVTISPNINLFSEKVGESMTNCSKWTQWATQQETMELRQKNLAPLSFSINPRFHLSQLCLLQWICLNCLAQLFVSTICLKHLPQLFVSTICRSPGEEHGASPPSLADHCSWLLWARSLHVFPWCHHDKHHHYQHTHIYSIICT